MTDIAAIEAPKTENTMAGQTALVTGSTNGIGLATAREFLAEGAKVMFTGIFVKDDNHTKEENREIFLKEYAALQKQYGKEKMDFLEIDLTLPGYKGPEKVDGVVPAHLSLAHDDVPSAAQEVVERAAELGHGHIDTIVHSAGVQRRKDLFNDDPKKQLTPEDMDWVYSINAKAGYDVILAARDYIRNDRPTDDPSKLSQIVFLSSVHGLVGNPTAAPYCGSKWSIQGVMAAMKHELAAKGVRINSVNPAFIETDLAVNPLKDMATKKLEAQGILPGSEGYQTAFDAMYESIKDVRLHLQVNPMSGKGEWIPMKMITDAVVNLANFRNGIASGESVQPDFGYVEDAHREAGAALFRFGEEEPDQKGIMEALNTRCASLGDPRINQKIGSILPEGYLQKPDTTLFAAPRHTTPFSAPFSAAQVARAS